MSENENKVLVCETCGEEIEEREAFEQKDGTFLCECCHDELYDTCEMCGEETLKEDLQWWGDCQICPACMEEQVPSFDEEENRAETAEALQILKDKYIGKKAKASLHGESIEIEWGEERNYTMTVEIDDDGFIADIDPISCEVMLYETVNSSQFAPYPVSNDDYDDAAAEIDEQILDDGNSDE